MKHALDLMRANIVGRYLHAANDAAPDQGARSEECRLASWWAVCGFAQDYWIPAAAGAVLALVARCSGA